MEKRYAIILAAGKGTRMKSKQYKVLHEVAHKPMVEHVLDNVHEAGFSDAIIVVGYGAEAVEDRLEGKATFCLQKEQLGTGHAVLQTKPLLGDKEGSTLVICGDTPLISAKTIDNLMDVHEREGAMATILTAHTDDPYGYGRVLRDAEGHVRKIVEEKDATDEERQVQEVNTGTYVFDNQSLFNALDLVTNDNEQGEYYLPDVISIMQKQGGTIAAYQMDDMSEAIGVNDRQALAEANHLFYKKQNDYWMSNGVTIMDPDSVYIDGDVRIGEDTVIEPNVQLEGKTVIGEDCHIGAQSILKDAKIGNRVHIRSSEIESSEMEDDSDIGPFSHLRPNALIKKKAHIGNFVEVKNATVGENTKVGHLTYIGDATIGKSVNVSCGVIFCNYDGVEKEHSSIGDYTFIGSNANIVAPVDVADHSFIAAGSTITKDVPAKAMAIARERQTNKEGYWDKLPIAQKKEEDY